MGNTTIANIPNGFHNLTIYANDTYGNIGNRTVNFTVEKPQTQNYGNTFTVAVIAISVAIICIVAALVLFRRHPKLIVLSK